MDLAKTYNVDLFSTFQLTCAAIGSPLPNISFFSTAETPIDVNNTFTKISGERISVTLHISGYNTSNETYWCIIANKFGTINSTRAIVNITGKNPTELFVVLSTTRVMALTGAELLTILEISAQMWQ